MRAVLQSVPIVAQRAGARVTEDTSCGRRTTRTPDPLASTLGTLDGQASTEHIYSDFA